MNDFRKNKTWLQKKAINLGLWLLRWAGNTPEKYETPYEVYDRRKSYFQELIDSGYHVEQMTEWQFRVNGVLDIYPKNARWHDIKRQKRGGFQGKNLARFVRKYFKEI